MRPFLVRRLLPPGGGGDVFLRLLFFDFDDESEGLRAGERKLFLDQRELQLAFLGEDAVENHLDAVAGAETAAGALADDLVCVFAPGEAVAAQGVDGDEALDEEIGELDEEAVFGGVEHQGGKLVADAVLHEANLLPLDQLALGLGGAALGLAGFFGDLGEFGLGDGRLMSEVRASLPRSPSARDPGTADLS